MLSTFNLLISIVFVILAAPIGLLLASMTKDEKNIYEKYFPSMLWIIAIAAAIFYTLNSFIALNLTFIFVLILSWNYADKIKLNKKKTRK